MVVVFVVVCGISYPLPNNIQHSASPGELGGENAQCNWDNYNGWTGQDYHGNTDAENGNTDDCYDQSFGLPECPIQM